MEEFVIFGGKKLFGEVDVPKSKNAFLPILSATILCEEKIVLRNNPYYSDVFDFLEILKFLGKDVRLLGDDIILEGEIKSSFVPQNLSLKLRSSLFSLGPILATKKHAKISMPGGCKIGKRPIDLHLFGLECLGVKIKETKDFVECDGKNMHSGVVEFSFPSVGATENVLMASVFLKGTTIIKNPAKEPEIVDLANFLNKMGAKVVGAGTDTITVEGVKKLCGTSHTPIPDRIFVGTMMLLSCLVGGEIMLKNAERKHVLSLSKNLEKIGFTLKTFDDRMVVQSLGFKKPLNLKTGPYPAFATDLQSQMLALLSVTNGTSTLEEKVFETRFQTAFELVKMGANIKVEGQKATICGVKKLCGTRVVAHDLRGGAGLVLAGLKAEGKTTIENIFHIDRGYFKFEKTLQSLGANITRRL